MANVLIVDDARFVRLTLTTILKKHHYTIVGEAQNGIEAIQMYEKFIPDVVLMDITMPEMDGLEATKEIMRRDSEAIIIMCSAMGQHKIVTSAIRAGAKDFIIKPFDENRIIETLERVLS